MTWKLAYSETAEKQITKLDKAVQRAVKKYLGEVCELLEPSDRGHPLTGPWAGYHRYRIGQIRIICGIERNIVTIAVIKIDRRDSIY
jgi:mRNA interferase RelE/StbE